MNISKILPILLKLQQPTNTPRQVSNNNFANQDLKNINAMKSTAAIVKEGNVKEQQDITHNRPAGHTEITYLPLPLKGEQFKSTMFFVRKYNGNKPINEPNSSAYFIKLDTYNLGVLWIGLEYLPQKGLGVRFVTEKETFRQAIAETLPNIRQDLEQLGYGKIITTCHVQPKVRHCQDIDPSANCADVITSLMNWTI
jgi:hypothetical protein